MNDTDLEAIDSLLIGQDQFARLAKPTNDKQTPTYAVGTAPIMHSLLPVPRYHAKSAL